MIPGPLRLVLASASPARLATLRAAGVDPQVVVSGVDESAVDERTPAATALALARLKATAVARDAPAGTLVLGCDSLLELDGQALGKPVDAAQAVARWRRMRGRAGVLHTGHCLIVAASGRCAEEVASTTVRFAAVSDREIDAYVGTGEPLQVAGAFTLDGLGGWFIEAVEGDHHNVVGVSLPLLRRLLGTLGVQVIDLWPHAASGAESHAPSDDGSFA